MNRANETHAAAGRRRFKPYAAYKDSGVEWLGEIPAHWAVRRLKTIASAQFSNVDKKSVEGRTRWSGEDRIRLGHRGPRDRPVERRYASLCRMKRLMRPYLEMLVP